MKFLFDMRSVWRRWSRCGVIVGVVFGSTVKSPAEVAVGIQGEPHVYKVVDGRELRVWVTKPQSEEDSALRPVMMFFHGGGWVGGSPRVFNDQSAYFSRRGMVCVNVEYRLLDRAVLDPPLICIQDAKSAIRWVRNHADELGADTNRIASFGASAGGHLAAVVGMQEGLDDPQDDLRISAQVQAMLMLNPVIHNGPGLDGYGYKRTATQFKTYSPFHYDKVGAPPAIIFIGTEDRVIPFDMVLRFKRAMEWAGSRCDVEIYHGEDHSFFNSKNAEGLYFYLTTVAADRFLSSLGWLKGKPTMKHPDLPVNEELESESN